MDRDETAVSTEQPRFRIGVFAVLERDGSYLLARRADIGWWNLPGGGLEYDEAVEEGLAREVREEIGVEITVVRLVGVYSKPRKREIVLSFLCHLAPGGAAPTTSEEVSEVGWFAPGALPEPLLPKHRERIEDALLGLPSALIRTQSSSTEEDQRLSPPHLA